jgi:hypothetical protein
MRKLQFESIYHQLFFCQLFKKKTFTNSLSFNIETFLFSFYIQESKAV